MKKWVLAPGSVERSLNGENAVSWCLDRNIIAGRFTYCITHTECKQSKHSIFVTVIILLLLG